MTDESEQRESIARRLANYIVTGLDQQAPVQSLLADDAVPLPEELDSVQLLDLAGFVEDEYGIILDEDAVNSENFHSVWVLADLVVRELG